MATEDSNGTGSDGAGESGDVNTDLSRDMSLADVTFIGVGAMIGAGVFALTGFAAGLAGPALTLAFLLNGVVAMFTAVSYAELGAAFPEAGGGYLWVKEALMPPNGFYAGWMSWFAHAVACSLYAVTFGAFLMELIHYAGYIPAPGPGGGQFALFGLQFLNIHALEKLAAVAMISSFAFINYRGAEETGTIGIIVTGIKVIVLGVYIGFGILATFNNPNWAAKFVSNPQFMPNGFFGIIGAMGFTYIAFEGYEIIVQSGEEVVNPGKNIPKAVFYSMAIVVPIYFLVAFASIGGISVTQSLVAQAGLGGQANVYTWEIMGALGEMGIIRAAGQFVPYGVPLLLFAGLAATMSALNATVYSSSRVSFAMGRDRALPAIFGRISDSQRTPSFAIWISAALIVLMAVALPIEAVAASADIMFILLFVQVNWTVIRMRQTHPDLPRTYEVPYMPWPPLIGIVLQILLTPFLVYTLGLQIGLGPDSHGFVALVTTAIWMGLGLVIYYGYSVQKEEEQIEEETPTVVRERHPGEEENQILVPIARTDNVEQLMRTAVDIAKENDASLLVMSVVTVPQQTPPSEGRKYVDEEREVVNEAMAVARDADVPVSGTVRVGHKVSDAILNTIDQYDSEMVLMGWGGQRMTQRRDIVLGSIVDTVATDADADVLVERIGSDATGEANDILVPVAGGEHSKFAAALADDIADQHGSHVDLVHVVDPGASESERKDAQEILDDAAAELDDVAVDTEILEGDSVVDTINDRTGDYDIVMVGATREGILNQFVFGSVPEKIGWGSDGTVIMAKRNLSITSKLGGLL